MKQLARRASLVVVLLLLASVGTTSAECAWVLWQQQGKLSPDGTVAPWDWTWIVGEAASTESECRKIAARMDGALGPKDSNGYATATVDGSRRRIRNSCLPDTVDPRGPKGK